MTQDRGEEGEEQQHAHQLEGPAGACTAVHPQGDQSEDLKDPGEVERNEQQSRAESSPRRHRVVDELIRGEELGGSPGSDGGERRDREDDEEQSRQSHPCLASQLGRQREAQQNREEQ